MRVLITGGSSLLGKSLLETKPATVDLSQTWFTNYVSGGYHLDICNKSQVAYIFERSRPDVVIHCAAVGSVDYTENHFTETHIVNVIGTSNIVNAAADHKALMVYISTNAVFAGDNPPYDESSECHPVNRYGSIKREAETVVRTRRNWLIIRPFLLYGQPYPGGRQNWYTTITRNLAAGKVTRLVNDRFWQHTNAGDVAAAIWKLVELGKQDEVYHVASDETMSLYDFGVRVAKHHKADPTLIVPMSSDDLPVGTAPRPVDTTYCLGKIHELGIYCRNVEKGLKGLK